MKTYAEVAEAWETENTRKIKQVNMEYDMEKLRKYSSMVKIEGTNIKLVMPEEERKKEEKKFRTFSNENRKIERAPKKEIDLIMSYIDEEIIFLTKGNDYGTVAVTFEPEEEAARNVKQVIEGDKRTLLPCTPGKRLVKIRVRRILPMIEPEWVLVAILGSRLQEENPELEIQLVSKIECWNVGGFGSEIVGTMTPGYHEKVPETIELPTGERLEIILTGRPPKCYKCGMRGHKMKDCIPMEELLRHVDIPLITHKEKLAEAKSRKRERKKSPTTAELKMRKGMEEEVQQRTENVEEPSTEIAEGEVELQSDEEVERKCLESHDKDTQKEDEKVQSDECTDKQECESIQMKEPQRRDVLEQHGNGKMEEIARKTKTRSKT
ncbi:---NA--- [Octopus vulgaris]|uniref:---NA n=1 Tax=Octopus vulgaris TaxID=6645 RepID=A0AA36BNH3_OCTVU|nr:---NA--- [Octopus vulgaris]